MTRQIGNDELGEIGEDQFKTLCSRARLIASKSTQDKMGWDYLVEFPLVDEAGRTLDQRRLPPSIRIQVKTIWRRDNDRVTLSLSAAEQLAKSHEPSFICALIADLDSTNEVEIVAAYLIPMIDENLARVLERLRKLAADNDYKPINAADITFSASKSGEQFDFNGTGLRSALVAVCGMDGDAIRNIKAQQLCDLGYDEGRLQLKVQFTAKNAQEISDAFVGLSPIEVSDLQEFDVRFGIPVPTDHLSGDGFKYKALFMPVPIAVRTMRVRGLNGGIPATFQCDIIMGPQGWGLPEETNKIIVKCSVFSLEIRGTGEGLFKMDGSAINELSLSLDDWAHFFRLCVYLNEGGALFELDGPDPSSPKQTLTINSPPSDNDRRLGEAFIRTISHAQKLLDEAGYEIGKLMEADIVAAAPDLAFCEQRRQGSKINPIVYQIDPADAHFFPAPLQMALIIPVDLGEHRIACVVVVTFTGPGPDESTWTESSSRVVRCSDVPQTDEGLSRFAEMVSKQTGIGIVMLASRGNPNDD